MFSFKNECKQGDVGSYLSGHCVVQKPAPKLADYFESNSSDSYHITPKGVRQRIPHSAIQTYCWTYDESELDYDSDAFRRTVQKIKKRMEMNRERTAPVDPSNKAVIPKYELYRGLLFKVPTSKPINMSLVESRLKSESEGAMKRDNNIRYQEDNHKVKKGRNKRKSDRKRKWQ